MTEPSTPATPQTDLLHEQLVEQLKVHVDSALGAGETVEAVLTADLASDGARFVHGALVVTTTRLLAVRAHEGAATTEYTTARADLRSLDIRESHSLVRLVACDATRGTLLGVFPRSRLRALRQLKQLVTPEPATPDPAAAGASPGGWGGHGGGFGAEESKKCPTCSQPIPRRIGFCPNCIDRGKLLVRLATLARPYVWPMSWGLLLMLVITAIEMAQPILTKILVDDVIPNADYTLFAWIVAGIIAIYVFTSLFSGSRSYLMAWLGEKIVHDLRTMVYRHLQTLSVDFYDERQTGWIMDRVSADTSNLQNFLAEGFQDLIRDIMTLVVILAIMFAMNWQLALITLLPAPIVFFMTWKFMRKIHRLFHANWRRRAYMTELLSNVIPGVRVVKAFAREKYEADRFADRSKAFMDASVRTARSFSTFWPITNFITSLGFIAVWSYGGYQAITGETVTVGTLIAFISYLWRFYGPLNSLSRFSQRIEHATTAAQRVFDVLDSQSSVKQESDAPALPPVKGEVTFTNVTFGYNPDEPVLKNISFTARPGEMIGLVGPSGAGKSTTINLLCRFYDTDEGTITIDGHDVRSVTVDSLHLQVGVVLQEPFLFHGTVAENICYGRPDATRTEIMRAARAANAHEFIMRFPDGYDALVGERGQRLSGGERQRIAIARAILKDPRILILDEATSSVDTETEAAIQQAIERLVKGRTTFAIAHRFSTLRNADRLVVLENGGIAEIGTHEELLAKPDGVFKRLVDIQTKSSQIVAIGG